MEEPLLRQGGALSIKRRLRSLRFAFGAGASSDGDSPSKAAPGEPSSRAVALAAARRRPTSRCRGWTGLLLLRRNGGRRGRGRGRRGARGAAPPRLGGRAALLVAAPSWSSAAEALHNFRFLGEERLGGDDEVLPLVRLRELCLGLGFAMGFDGGRASSSEEVERTIPAVREI